MNRLVASKIIRSRSVKKEITSHCSVCNGFMFNAKRYMCMDDAYFTSNQITIPFEAKQIFSKIIHVLNYLDNQHHFALDLDQLERIFDYRYLQSSTSSFPVTVTELEYMFDTLGFLWIHHNSPQYMFYLVEQLAALFAADRENPLVKCTTETTLQPVSQLSWNRQQARLWLSQRL